MSDSIQTSPSASEGPTAERLADAPAPMTAEQPDMSKDAHTGSTAPAIDFRVLTDRALHFLATATNETLGACLVGLSAGTYLVLGRVGLLLIGIAGGVVLHATWEGHATSNDDEQSQHQGTRKRELGADVARRVLDWREKTKSNEEEEKDDLEVQLNAGKKLDYSEFRPETAAALTELTDAVIRDYVKWWYAPILPGEEQFPLASRQTLTAFLLSVSNHLSRKRPADNFVDFVTRSSSFMIIFFQEISSALNASPNSTAEDAVDTYLAMKPGSTLGQIIDTRHQMKQFDTAAVDILQNYLESKTYNCKPAQVFLRQILAQVVLGKIVDTCSKPEWINGWIVYLLEDGEPELMEAIDAGVEGSSPQLKKMKKTVEKEEQNMGDTTGTGVRSHQRAVSQAQDAMDQALKEAQRLTQLMAEEDAKRSKDQQEQQQAVSTPSFADDQSESTTHDVVTPTSSQSETLVDNEATDLGIAGLPPQSTSQVDSPSPKRMSPTKAVEEAPTQETKKAFTSFDQLVPQQPPTALMSSGAAAIPPLTLHNCKMSIFDDAMPGEKGTIKNKPTAEYLIQIEPASNHHPGWMTARKYLDFETLHEVLRRIAPITGTTGFTEAHSALPQWKGHSKASLRGELERYLNDAVQYRPLAESEGMKRFLEKESQMGKSPKGGFPGLGWPGQTFETMGKGMVDVLTKAPKEVAGGGNALFKGVTGLVGSVATPFGGAKKSRDSIGTGTTSPAPSLSRSATSTTTPTQPIQNRHGRAESTVSELPTHIRTESVMTNSLRRTSTESSRAANSPIIDQQPQREPMMERRPSYNPDGDGRRSRQSSVYGASRNHSRAASARESMDLSPLMGGDQILNLPPAPSEMPDDYSPYHTRNQSRASTTSLSLPTESAPPLPRRPSATSLSHIPAKPPPAQGKRQPKTHAALSEQETTVLIELIFAVINELYTLSSAWTLRRTLLNAAKTFLLRPGNPQLESIRTLMQTSVLDENTSDKGIAYHLRKIRENSLPTEEELAAWPAEMSAEEKEKLRVKARKLLVERGMPQALTSVMGQAASGEALGKVFDALQEPRLARGVIFGLTLQGLRAVTQ